MNARRIASSIVCTSSEKSTVANISRVTDRIWTGGDLPSHLGDEAMLVDLADYQRVGISHVLDNRIECSDEAFVEVHAPKIDYFWNGQDDAGQSMPDEWFFDGVDFALEALLDPNAQVLTHCHMGINRGPSIAKRERAEVATWHRRNPIDVVRIIRTIRSHEDSARPLSA